MSCIGCYDPNQGRKVQVKMALLNAKQLADENKTPQAICEDGENIFIYDAFKAFEQRFRVLQVVSGSEVAAGNVPELSV